MASNPVKAKTLELLKRKTLNVEFKLEATVYKAVQNIGTGAYGVVCKAIDTRNGKLVAVKKIPGAFTAITLVKRTLREVKILTNFRHENIVAVLDMLQAQGTRGPDIYLVMDLMETDLHQIIHSKQQLSDSHYQYFLYQILRGLKYIHSAGVIHRDLKPSNLFVNADCLLKLGDFGMARSMEQGPENQGSYMTQYVATRWYRAPELVFSMLDYSCSVDIWSVGCIFAEMVMRRQLFPGKDPISQVKMIVHYLGTPEQAVMDRISSDLIKRWIASCGFKTPLPWHSILPKASNKALDLVAQMLQVAPWKRISATKALEHPYLATYHNPQYEPVCPQQVVLETDAIEKLSVDQLKAALSHEVQLFHQIQNHQAPAVISPDLAHPPTANGMDEGSDDVIMLSAQLDDSLDIKQQKEATSETTKAALRDALLRKSKNDCNRQVTVNAQSRYLERVERRKKRDEKQLAQEQQERQNEMTREDQTLLERWDKIHKTAQQQKLEGQIVDILYESFPSPIESSSGTSASSTAQDGLKCTAAKKKQLDSAQLMDTWLQATNLDPEQLEDLEKEITMATP